MKKKAEPEIDIEKTVFTAHAIKRFSQRFFQLNPGRKLSDPEKTARKLLARATEKGAIDSVGRVKRIIDSGFKEARYFMQDG